MLNDDVLSLSRSSILCVVIAVFVTACKPSPVYEDDEVPRQPYEIVRPTDIRTLPRPTTVWTAKRPAAYWVRDGQTIVRFHEDRSAHRLHLDTGKVLSEATLPDSFEPRESGREWAAQLAVAGGRVLILQTDTARLVDLTSGEVLKEIDIAPALAEVSARAELSEGQGPMTRVHLTETYGVVEISIAARGPGASSLVVFGTDGTHRFTTKSAGMTSPIEFDSSSIGMLQIDTSGSTALAQEVLVYDSHTGEILRRFPVAEFQHAELIGSRLVVGSETAAIVYDYQTGKQIWRSEDALEQTFSDAVLTGDYTAKQVRRLSDGKAVWKLPADELEYIASDEENYYFVAPHGPSVVVVLDRATGAEKRRLDSPYVWSSEFRADRIMAGTTMLDLTQTIAPIRDTRPAAEDIETWLRALAEQYDHKTNENVENMDPDDVRPVADRLVAEIPFHQLASIDDWASDAVIRARVRKRVERSAALAHKELWTIGAVLDEDQADDATSLLVEAIEISAGEPQTEQWRTAREITLGAFSHTREPGRVRQLKDTQVARLVKMASRWLATRSEKAEERDIHALIDKVAIIASSCTLTPRLAEPLFDAIRQAGVQSACPGVWASSDCEPAEPPADSVFSEQREIAVYQSSVGFLPGILVVTHQIEGRWSQPRVLGVASWTPSRYGIPSDRRWSDGLVVSPIDDGLELTYPLRKRGGGLEPTVDVEIETSTVRLFWSDIEADGDGDGWTDRFEQRLVGTSPTMADTDGDGIDDPIDLAPLCKRRVQTADDRAIRLIMTVAMRGWSPPIHLATDGDCLEFEMSHRRIIHSDAAHVRLLRATIPDYEPLTVALAAPRRQPELSVTERIMALGTPTPEDPRPAFWPEDLERRTGTLKWGRTSAFDLRLVNGEWRFLPSDSAK